MWISSLAWSGPTYPRANAAALRTEYPAESWPTGPAVTHGTRRSTRPGWDRWDTDFSTAVAVSCSMKLTISSRDWNLSVRVGVWDWDTGYLRV